MKRSAFLLALSLALGAQDPSGVPSPASEVTAGEPMGSYAQCPEATTRPPVSPADAIYDSWHPIRPSVRSGQGLGQPRSGWQPGQSAAIGLESGGDPAQQGAPAERVEASRKFAGGGVGGDTQSREAVPLFSRPAGDESRLVGCDGDIQTNQPNKGNERAGGTSSLRPQAQVGLSATGSAGSTPARLHQLDELGSRLGVVTASPLPSTSTAGWPWKVHLADTLIHGAATSLDAASSWGRMEANPILRSADGRFGAQGLSIKLGIFAGMELAKWKLARRYPRSKLVRAISLAPAAAFGGVAARNWRVQ